MRDTPLCMKQINYTAVIVLCVGESKVPPFCLQRTAQNIKGQFFMSDIETTTVFLVSLNISCNNMVLANLQPNNIHCQQCAPVCLNVSSAWNITCVALPACACSDQVGQLALTAPTHACLTA